VFSIIVAGVFLVSADGGYRVATSFGRTLSEEYGKGMIDMAIETIRSVAKGVLGVAVIQSLLSAIGLVAIGVPGAGIWAGVILLLAIMQLPPLLVLGPIAVWVFSVEAATPATIFAIYAFFVSISDSFLKPLFLGRGMDIPMLVILVGAIGGMMTYGIVGLFVGAVVLAVGYKLLISWMAIEEEEEQEAQAQDSA
jgi:predicted PurR-regulated permease PerM